jgi:uncharacterized membrane protein YgaE (UPF0421/DUF939 family)
MAKIDIDGDGKPDFSLSLPNIVMIVGGIVSLVSSYYMLDNKIEQAMKSPVQEVVQRDIDGLKNEIDFRFEKIEKELEDEKQHVKELEVELRTQYKRK